MASILHLALLLLSIASQQVLAAKRHHTINVESLLSSAMCSRAPAAPATPASHPGGGSSLQIVRRSCPTTGALKTVSDHYTTILRRDHHRVQSIHRRLGEPRRPTTIPARLGLPFHTYEYVVTIGIGTPPRNLTVLFDTGSDLTWVQCTPCSSSCYHQEEPLFDPSKSSTYAHVACSAEECNNGDSQETSCAEGWCRYTTKYSDESHSGGNLAYETVTLLPLAPPATRVVFGCSDESSDFNDMSVAGLLGLGRGEWSIPSQIRQNYGSSFSYCLPPHGSSTGYLTFGAALQSQANLTFTPLKPDPDFYLVDLTGISVNGADLPLPADAFSARVVIDSGTVITRLEPTAYSLLRNEFMRHMLGYTVVRVKGLDTCYDVTGRDVVTVPRVALEFGGGARIDVDASGILIVAAASGASVACLAFAPLPPDVSRISAIIGNMQQRAYTVVFDVEGGRVGFGANGCS
ncbi:aspartyl protease family protein At5g10770-like [Phragmites australis]|uniref:aspartyl protease family protein At5g10770-like n=1 Tax=Phragmites australis TaxID=29695 RepID=UPI002D77DF59|nr:aspartyl protease family protein At5g10770-like [Phragmites australis]